MGLMQKAVETYDCFASIAGLEFADKATLAPVSHLTTAAQLEITLDQDGRFISARAVDKTEPKIVIPVTEASTGRVGNPAAHAICDQLCYVASFDTYKNAAYTTQLAEWIEFDPAQPKLRAILAYVQGETILSDLLSAMLIKLNEKGQPANPKMLVRWIVNGLSEQSGPCWTDTELMQSFIRFYAQKRQSDSPSLCLITGAMELPSEQHPKGIIPFYGNAKLISSNDTSGFTFRGRFRESWQAASASYTASQKAHNALRWVAANQGINAVFGGRTFLCWNPQGVELPHVTGAMARRTDASVKAVRQSEYREQLQQTLRGWKTNLPMQCGVVIAAFDAATTGRLALTYYNELEASDFLERLYRWDDTCCFMNGSFGIQSPTLYHIVSCSFGIPRDERIVVDDKILRQQLQRLVTCRIDCALFPLDIERAIVHKASNLLLYNDNVRERLLFTACSVIRKYHIDHYKEEYSMSLDPNNKDRSYLFGRLLAIAEAVERSTYDSGDGREPNAMRMQPVFVQRPMYAWRVLEERLNPYYAKLDKTKPGLLQYFKDQIAEIASSLPADQAQLNRKLEDVYLLGYYHQRAFRKKNAEQATEEDGRLLENTDNEE